MILSEHVARSLHRLGVRHAFGVVGIPVTEMAEQLQRAGIHFICFRNEQAASYAAACFAYLVGGPAVLLTTAGPGFLHSMPGIASASVNGWPLLVVTSCYGEGGESERFQETNHREIAGRYVCGAFKVRFGNALPCLRGIWQLAESRSQPVLFEIERACLESDKALEECAADGDQEGASPKHGDRQTADLSLLQGIEYHRPLVVIGVEAALYQWEEGVAALISATGFPYITMPMAKGVLPDDDAQCVAAARTLALQEADLVVLVGAYSNWMLPLHRSRPTHKRSIISVTQRTGQPNALPNCITVDPADLCALARGLERTRGFAPWLGLLREKQGVNEDEMQRKSADEATFSYHAVYGLLKQYLTRETVLVTEGSNTMDIARAMLPSFQPRRRLDAGVFGAMGMCMGGVVAARLCYPQDPIVAVVGDSAFGFSMAELEVVVRYRMRGVTVIVMNNAGIYSGIDGGEYEERVAKAGDGLPMLPTTALYPHCRYDKLAEMFGGSGGCGVRGFLVRDRAMLREALEAKADVKILNCVISSLGQLRAHI